MARIKSGREYFTFPGGKVEADESVEEALQREIEEETGLQIQKFKRIFEIQNNDQREVYYIVEKFQGLLRVGGPEGIRMDESNQYSLVWISISELHAIDNLYPKEAVDRLLAYVT